MKKLLAVALGLLLLGSSCASVAQRVDDTSYSDESVVLSAAEADSILDMIDDQGLRIELLEVDLWEQRRMAEVDSTLAATRYHIKELEVEALRGNVFTRFFKHPVVWLALGVWLGGQ